MKRPKLYMNNYSKFYYWLLLNLKITSSYFIVCLISVIIGILSNTDSHLIEGDLSIIDTIQVFLVSAFYPIPFGVLFMFILDKVFETDKVSKKKRWFVTLNIIWHFLFINSYANWDTIDGWDKKGFSHLYLFIGIMTCLIIFCNIFWVHGERKSFSNSGIERNKWSCRWHKSIVVFFIAYYICTIIPAFFYTYTIGGCFDGLIFDEMLMSFNGLITFLVIGFGSFLFLIKKVRSKYLIIVLIPVIYLCYNSFILQPGYNSNSKFHKFRNLLIHYNPIWLNDEDYGHTELSPR